jgi:hypothetical protein
MGDRCCARVEQPHQQRAAGGGARGSDAQVHRRYACLCWRFLLHENARSR